MTPRLSLALALAIVLVAPGAVPALAQPDSVAPDQLGEAARQHLDAGLAHHDAGEYEAALAEFRAGYEIEPSPLFLFAMAQAERLSGDCPSAEVYYQEFLDTDPAPRHAEAARGLLEQCRAALTSRPEPPPPSVRPDAIPIPTPLAAPPPATPIVTGSRARTDRESWYGDRLGTTLLGLGAVSAGIGIGYFVAARNADRAADQATDYDQFTARVATARRDQRIALVGAAAATTLLGVWTVRYLLRKREHHSGLSAAIAPDRVQASLRVEF